MARHTPGNYVPLDVNYPHDRAIREAGTNAELLFIRALAYAKRTRSGGFVPDYDLQLVAVGMRSIPAAVASLLRVALWAEVDGGWQIRSWERWNAGTEAVSAGGKLGNHKRWHADRGVIDPECDLCGDRPLIAPDIAPDSPGNRQSESQGKGREGKGRTEPKGSGRKRPRGSTNPDSEEAEEAQDPTAQSILAAWIDRQRKRPAGQVIGQVGRHVKQLLAEDFTADQIEAGLATLDGKQLHPSTLPSLVSAVANAGPAAMYDVSKLPEPGTGWSEHQLDMVLGKDAWQVPDPPDEMDEDDGFLWQQQEHRRHFALRVQAALKATGRTA